MGKKLPEESVKIPKIGEWSIAPTNADLESEPSPTLAAKETKFIPKVKSKLSTKPEPPYHIRAPKSILEDSQQNMAAPKISHPPGSTTTDLTVIMKSKVRMPNRPLPPLKKENLESEESFLPLELFDDTKYSQYSTEDLLKKPGAYSKFHELNGGVRWEKVNCNGYDPETELFLIEWEKSNGKKLSKKVARFNIRFEIEDKEMFEARVEAARRACHRYEMQYRFDARVDQMPTEHLPELSEEDVNNIKALTSILIDQQTGEIIDPLCNEVEDNFKKINNKLEFIYELQHNTLLPNRDDFLDLFNEATKARSYGLVTEPSPNFQKNFENFSKNYLKANPFIYQGLLTISTTFQQSLSINFLTGGFEGLLSLDEYVKLQTANLDSTCKLFKTSIQETLESVISSIMNDKSIPSNHNQERILYQKMVSLTQIMLHTVLLDVIDSTLSAYSYQFTKFTNTEECFLYMPQFSLDLELNNQKEIVLVPSIGEIRERLLSLLILLEKSIVHLPDINLPILDVNTHSISYDDCATSIINSRINLERVIDNLFVKLETFLNKNSDIEPVIKLNPQEFIEQFDPEGKMSLDSYHSKLVEIENVINICENDMNPSYKINIFFVSCRKFKESSLSQTKGLKDALLNHMKNLAMSDIKVLQKTFREIDDRLHESPETPEELGALKEYMEKIRNSTTERQEKIEFAKRRFDFLDAKGFKISDQEFQEKFVTLGLPHKLSTNFDETERMIAVKQVSMARELKGNQHKLEADTLSVTEELPNFISTWQNLEYSIDAFAKAKEINDRINELKKKQEQYNRHEKLFGIEPAQSKNLSKLIEEFSPLYELWELAKLWVEKNTEWPDRNFAETKVDEIKKVINYAIKNISKLKKSLAPQKSLMDKVLAPLNYQIEEFNRHIPLLSLLCHKGIQTKHWDEISKIIGKDAHPSSFTNLQGYIDLKLEDWYKGISLIANKAIQEYDIDQMLEKIVNEISQLKFTVGIFRDTESYIFYDFDSIVSVIDDHLVTTQSILMSTFIGEKKNEALKLLETLRKGRDTLDSWIKCQRGWLYLQPIFTGTTIQQKLIKEAGDWKRVNDFWNVIMRKAHENPLYNNNIKDDDSIFSSLEENNEYLERISQRLDIYLETKRNGFPRFFFLSNDELISILSHTKDFDQIQKSMSKLFEYVHSIKVNSDLEITHMCDHGLEEVELNEYVNGNTPEIEDWLNSFEKKMQDTIKENIGNANRNVTKKKREQWISEYPAQVILTVNQILWTAQVTGAIRKKDLKSLSITFSEQLEGLTVLCRQNLSRSLSNIVKVLIILEVHNRDIIQHLLNEKISDIKNFSWIKQLRHYWENDTVVVRSINNEYEYAYEYAGNSDRLVITPLTDRCYQTLLATFKQNMSCAPSGPAGTGKTESVRDCAKALGRPCVVYNCSEEVTPKQMSQFFAGLATSGAWSCFDEFNRINIEVLSVIAQQVRTIQNAVANGVDIFNLDQRKLKLNMNASICITMNPGYAGRTELPDNLKALFRPCAMMVPDFVFISEILLYSGGYTSASALSVKLVALFDLCRKQLSNACHYDWGLRAMKAILYTAGNSKRRNLEAKEDLLLFESIRDCTLPRLVNLDISLFEGILVDVFPEVSSQKIIEKKMLNYMRESYNELYAQPLDIYINKCNEIFETSLVRHGIMFVGGTISGKTTSWKALQKTLTKLSKDGIGSPVDSYVINPKSISISELYGLLDLETMEWKDGVLSSFIRKSSMTDSQALKWIVVDGPVDSDWIETMNSLLDDNKVLCLSSNERISLGSNVRMMFEVDDLSEASPATVSRTGMIYFDPITLPWEAMADSWVTRYSPAYGSIIFYIRELMNKYVPKMVQFLQVDAKPVIGSNTSIFIRNMLKIINSFFEILLIKKEAEIDEVDDNLEENQSEVVKIDHSLYFSRYSKLKDHKIPYQTNEAAQHSYEKVLIFSLIWSFGAILDENSRELFDNFIKDLLDKEGSVAKFTGKDLCFNYFIDFENDEWSPWIDGGQGQLFTSTDKMDAMRDNPIESVFIPTPESAALVFLIRLLVEHQQHVLIHGPESSKTLVVKNLYKHVFGKQFDCRNLPLANCSTPKKILEVFRSYLHKRRGVYGPLTNMQLVVFLDNIGSVKPEKYGAQPPLELIRQFLDSGGWYNTSNLEFQNIVDTSLIAAMGPAGSGLYSIPQRLMRHFNIIHAPKMDESSMKRVLSNILNERFSGFKESITQLFGATVDSMVKIHQSCVENLLPIPSKLHYIFSLRNIIRVLKGIALIDHAEISNSNAWVRLYYHETMREYYDRFNTNDDRSWFTNLMEETLSHYFKTSLQSISLAGSVMFNPFSDGGNKYKEVKSSLSDVLEICNSKLEQHNRESEKQLDIVLFDEAIDHINNICRVLKMPRGHIMLLGIRSSGRKSLARLSLHISTMEIVEIHITREYNFNKWREDIKNLMIKMGVEDEKVGFVITDSQIIGSFQLEDLSTLLIHGEIPDLFDRKGMEEIKSRMSTQRIYDNEDPWAEFIKRTKENLHIILVFSPYGSIFKESMLSFPALRTESTIDWYMPWSRNALVSVAESSLKEALIQNKETYNSVVNACVQIHKSVEDASTRFLKETKRFTTCTPSRYFELLRTFLEKYHLDCENMHSNINKYVGGVDKITKTKKKISELKNQYNNDLPILREKTERATKTSKDLEKKKSETEVARENIKKQKEMAEKEEQKASEAHNLAQEKLNEAKPARDDAIKAVASLKKDDLFFVKTLKKVNDSLMPAFEALCVIFQIKPKKIDGPTPGSKIDDYWSESLSLINRQNFVDNVKGFKIQDLDRATVEKLKKYVGADEDDRKAKEDIFKKGSETVGSLYNWVCKTFDYWYIHQQIVPLEKDADEARAALEVRQKILNEMESNLKAKEYEIEELQKTHDKQKEEERVLQESVSHKGALLKRATDIMDGLEKETERWGKIAKNLEDNSQYLLGDALLASACFTHLAAFSPSFRIELLSQWKIFLGIENITFTQNFSIEKSLGSDIIIQDWVAKDLPDDTHSKENAIIITDSKKSFPLMIDPQLNGTEWLIKVIDEKLKDQDDKLQILRFDQVDFLVQLKNCVKFGKHVLIPNITLKLDPLIEPILSREIITKDGIQKISIGGEDINYNENFRLYLSTKYPNPHYSPEICSQVTLVNFTTTPDGLSDLLKNNLIEVESAENCKKRRDNMVCIAESDLELKKAEDEILKIVSNVTGDILEDNNAVETIQNAQKKSSEIIIEKKKSKKTLDEIDKLREKFSPVAARAAGLYFCASDFQVIDPMYQFSLKWFVSLFKDAIAKADHKDPNNLIPKFNSAVTRAFYNSMSFSLFSRHKLLFSTLMAIRILRMEKKIDPAELAFLISPKMGKEPNPTDWLPDEIWNALSTLSSIYKSQKADQIFSDLNKSLTTNKNEWMKYYNSNTPEIDDFPYKKKFSHFQQLLILRIFHLHRLREGLRVFVNLALGDDYVSPPTFNLKEIFEKSSKNTPIIFITTPGIDPQDEIIQVAQSMDLEKYLKPYSLGRDRGNGAKELIEESSQNGFWVLLQNCHLSLSWMPELENIIDNLLTAEIHDRFRLCLVTMSSPEFPIGILYQGRKLIYEIPKGIRENMIRVYSTINADEYNEEMSEIERKLSFHLTFYHSVVLERINFGSLGWNVPYEFNPSDLAISRRHLRMFLNESPIDTIPFESLGYVIGELNYGGRVTDKWDRRLLLALLRRYFSPRINDQDFTLGNSYKTPEYKGDLSSAISIFNDWPVVTEGRDVGLSENASTISARNEVLSIFDSLLEIEPTLATASSTITKEQFTLDLVDSLIQQIPQKFNIYNFTKNFNMNDTIHTVLRHEILLYNNLLDFIRTSLVKLKNGLKGLIVMDDELEHLATRLISNKIPESWLSHSYPSILKLNSYMSDLNGRVQFFDEWIRKGRPFVFKLSAFYHPEEFLTAILQVYARKHVVPIDTLCWSTNITNINDDNLITSPPEEGVYIKGLYIEGAKWDTALQTLVECEQKEIISILPLIHLLPTQEKSLYNMDETYECMMYRMQNRGSGALGLPNYIMSLFIPSKDTNPDHWILRSVAVFITVQE